MISRKELETSLKIIRQYLETHASQFSDELWEEFFNEWEMSYLPTTEEEFLEEFEEFLSEAGVGIAF